jgi:hypothetical protein
MDPITTAIVAALTAGIKKVGEKAVVESYGKLKELLKKKFGENSDIADSVAKLESKPESEGRRKMLAEEVKETGAQKDQEVLEAVKNLMSVIQSQPGGSEIILKVEGSGGAAVGKGAVAAGERGVIAGGDVKGSTIITGDNSRVIRRRKEDE